MAVNQTAGRNEREASDARALHEQSMVFPIGAPNNGFAQYFIGQPAGTLEQMRPLFDGSLTSVRNAHTEPETETAREVTEVIEIAEQPAGATAAAAAALHRQPDEPCPPTYLGWSIFLLICCCSPLSLAAVIASICTSSYYGRGRLDSARKASEVAAWLVMISIALGLIPVILMSCLFD